MVAKVAEAKGIHVTMQDISNPKLKARELEDEADSIDYLVCSSDLHPADVHRLIGRVHKGTFFDFQGHCSQEIKNRIPDPVRRVQTTRSSTHSHPFQVTLPNPRTLAQRSSFIP